MLPLSRFFKKSIKTTTIAVPLLATTLVLAQENTKALHKDITT